MNAKTSGRRSRQHTWLTPAQVEGLPYGTAIAFASASHRGPHVRGRLTGVIGPDLLLDTCGPDRSVTVPRDSLTRARLVRSLLDEGDPVLLRGVSVDDWRGGVIRVGDGGRVLVETLTGVEWFDEGDLVRADLVGRRPAGPTGRVPAPSAAADADEAHGRARG